MMAKVPSDMRERMPLQASATSSGMDGSTITFPSRKTGTPSRGSTPAATRDASNCKGKVIWLKTMAGIGIIRTRNARGNNKARRKFHPEKEDDQSGQQKQHGEAREENFGSHLSDDKDQQGEDVIARPLQEGRKGSWASRLAFLPDDESGKERNEEAMRKVRIMPPLRHQVTRELAHTAREKGRLRIAICQSETAVGNAAAGRVEAGSVCKSSLTKKTPCFTRGKLSISEMEGVRNAAWRVTRGLLG